MRSAGIGGFESFSAPPKPQKEVIREQKQKRTGAFKQAPKMTTAPVAAKQATLFDTAKPVEKSTDTAVDTAKRLETEELRSSSDLHAISRAVVQAVEDSSLHETIVRTAPGNWQMEKSSFLKTSSEVLKHEQVLACKNDALRLLDSVTAGGALPLQESELHVFHVFTQCYEEDVIDTVIQKNVNVIDDLLSGWEAVQNAVSM